MVSLSKFKTNAKYYINLEIPCRKDELNLRVIIHEVIHKTNPNAVDHVLLSTLSSSKDIMEECGFNPITVPLPCIKKIIHLHDILNDIFIDDILYLINEYI
jgi:hypothetical protein